MTAYSVTWAQPEILRFIASLKSARLTGSFARCQPHNNSDLDFKIENADLKLLIAYIKTLGIEFNSELPGHITFDGMEFFDGFCKQRGCPKTVQINGVEFRTW